MRYASTCAFAFLFLLLAVGVMAGMTAPTDSAIRAAVHRFASDDMTTLARLLSLIGSNLVWIAGTAVAGAVLWLGAQQREALALAATMAGAALLDNGLKAVFQRARPEPFFGTAPDTFSLPSGHALFAICFYGALVSIITPKLGTRFSRCLVWTGAFLLILCIGLSRIYLGVHYPSDVLAGYLAGAGWLTMLHNVGAFRRVVDQRSLS